MKTLNYDLIIIGAGPAGLMAAIQAGTAQGAPGTRIPGVSILVLEKKPRPGRKLLVAGTGRCNISHTGGINDYLTHYGEPDGGRRKLLKSVLYGFSPEKLTEFFSLRGLPIKELHEGKLFPESERSIDVLKLLLHTAEEAGACFHCGDPVQELSCEKPAVASSRPFHVRTASGALYRARSVILASGGASWPKTGSAGDGYRIAESLGHTLVTPRPALAPIELEAYPFAELSGISVPVELRIPGFLKKSARLSGDLLFTHRGLSGPVVLNSSRYLAQGLPIEISFTAHTAEELRNLLSGQKAGGGRLVKSGLHLLQLPDRFIRLLLRQSGVSEELKLAQLGKRDRQRIIRLLTSWPLRVSRVGGWDRAMLTAGGIRLSEVDPGTLESRLVPGLFFAGEVLDIDGDEGGYNLQFAFSSGAVAGRTAAAKIL